MDLSQIVPSLSSTTGVAGSVENGSHGNSFADLGTEDFFKLLIMQLTNQDPFEPTGNEELLQQISSIRDIELSTTLTESLRSLTGQQHFASASSLIGQYVTGIPVSGGQPESGIVVGVRFDASGNAVLQLASGTEMPLEQVGAIQSPLRAAEGLIGQTIVGVDQRDPSQPQVVEGLVTAVRVEEHGEILLELDTGDDLRFRDVVNVTAAAA